MKFVHRSLVLPVVFSFCPIVGSAWALPTPPKKINEEEILAKGYTVCEESQKWTFQTYSLMTEKQIAQILQQKIRHYSEVEAYKLAEHIYALSRQFNFDPAVVLSMIDVESGFQLDAVSSAGALGLMQIMPATGKWMAESMGVEFPHERILFDPFVNISIGIHYLAYLRDKYKNGFNRFLAAYNAGPGVVDRLLQKRRFRPRVTKPYIEKIRARIPAYRLQAKNGESS